MIRELFFTLLWAVSLTLTLLFVAARMLYVGLGVAPGDFTQLRRDSRLVIRALLANFVIVPALGVVLAAMSWIPAHAALAIVIVALLAGGVDFFALGEPLNDESRLAAVLTFVLSMVGGLISPIVRVLIQPSGVPMMASLWKVLAITLLAAPLPLVVGLLVRRTAPAAARVLSKAMALVAVLLFVAAAAATLVVKAPLAAEIGVRGVLAMMVLLVGAGLVGWLLGGPSAQQRTLLARTTMMRNAGLGLLLAIAAFPDAGVDVAIVLFVVLEVAFRVVWLLIGWNMIPSIPTLRSGKS